MSWINAVAVRHLALVHARAIPLTRGECVGGPRPCQYETCKYHLRSKLESCVLDVADRGGRKRSEVAAIMGVSVEKIVRIEDAAIRRIERNPNSYQNLKQFVEPPGLEPCAVDRRVDGLAAEESICDWADPELASLCWDEEESLWVFGDAPTPELITPPPAFADG